MKASHLVPTSTSTSTPTSSDLPRWATSWVITWIGVAVVAATLAVAVGFNWHGSRMTIASELDDTALLARVLEDHANRTFDTLDVALSALAESTEHDSDTARVSATLVQAQRALPFMRSVSVMTANGRVIASSVADNVGVTIDLKKLALPMKGSTSRLGSLVFGRDLKDAALKPAGSAAAPVASNRHFLPLVHVAGNPSGPPVYLVAAINPDFFATQQELLLADSSRSAALLGIDGQLIAATERIRMVPGQSAASHQFFTKFLPARESGTYLGSGLNGTREISAFRTLRNRPIVIITERDYSSVREVLDTTLAWTAAGWLALTLVVGAATVAARRSLRGHEAMRYTLNKARRRVADNERDMRTLVESVQELIFRTDASGCIMFINRRWQQLTGLQSSLAVGHRLSAFCSPGDKERVDALFDPRSIAVADSVMVSLVTSQGPIRILEVSATAIKSAHGDVTAFVGFAVDVSERQQARDRLQEQVDFNTRLLEVSPAAMFVKNSQGRYSSVNNAWLDLMGLNAGDLASIDWGNVPLGDDDMHARHDAALLAAGGSVRYESRLRRADGEVRDTVVSKVAIAHADGSSAGIVGSVIDVTEFREAERITREAKETAESANRAKSEFIANISHELRTPLQAIIGFSEMGSQLGAGEPVLEEMFKDIESSGHRMLTLVNGLLDLSKMEATVGDMALKRCDVVDLVAQVAKELKLLAARKRLDIFVSGKLQRLYADIDPFRIQQVVRNVLANAVRFSPEGSSVAIDVVQKLGNTVEIRVRDHGPGIPPDEIENIFEAFVQSSRTRDGSGGTGLGLTISRKIMSAHGGSIHASNAASGGAVVHIELPPMDTGFDRPTTSFADLEFESALAMDVV
ncbi:hypothetical protein BH09PSE5_BH09PSE5_35980 [soil metagenome]